MTTPMADVVESLAAEVIEHFGSSAGTTFTAREAGRQAANIIRARLSQAGAGGGVVVKPLEWRAYPDARYAGGVRPGWFDADVYGIKPYRTGGGYHVSDPGYKLFHQRFATLDEAKAAAQADYSARILSALAPTPPAPVQTASVEAVAEAYSDGQRDALAEATWMHDKAWQDAVLMLVYYTDLDKRDARVTKTQAEKGRAQAWAHCLKLASTKTAEDIAPPPHPAPGHGEAVPVADALDLVRLGARAMRRMAQASCGNHSEGALEDAMTSAGLSKEDKTKLYAEANAADHIRKDIAETIEDSALGYASYMGDDDDRKALAAFGVTSNWLYRRANGQPSKPEIAAEKPAKQEDGDE